MKKIAAVVLVGMSLTGCAVGTPLGDFQTRVSYAVSGVLSPTNRAWNCYNSWGNRCGQEYGFSTSPSPADTYVEQHGPSYPTKTDPYLDQLDREIAAQRSSPVQ